MSISNKLNNNAKKEVKKIVDAVNTNDAFLNFQGNLTKNDSCISYVVTSCLQFKR